MSDSYLDIAEKAIRFAKRPLHPKEILSIALHQGLMPEHLKGATQYNTIAARLSTDIRSPSKSTFYRTAANRFFLREFEDQYNEEYHAPRREKTLHAENVLSIPDGFLKKTSATGVFKEVQSFLLKVLDSNSFKYVARRNAEKRYDIKQVVSYALIYRSGMLLTYRRGSFSNAADELQGKRSIGFGGHVTDNDMNLFDIASLGVIENARRELSEELVMETMEFERLSKPSSFSFLCGINTYDSDEARKHIAITLVYFCSDNFEAKKNEMSVNDLRWCRISDFENNLDDFEPWSKVILSGLYSGKLEIEAC